MSASALALALELSPAERQGRPPQPAQPPARAGGAVVVAPAEQVPEFAAVMSSGLWLVPVVILAMTGCFSLAGAAGAGLADTGCASAAATFRLGTIVETAGGVPAGAVPSSARASEPMPPWPGGLGTGAAASVSGNGAVLPSTAWKWTRSGVAKCAPRSDASPGLVGERDQSLLLRRVVRHQVNGAAELVVALARRGGEICAPSRTRSLCPGPDEIASR